MTINYDISTEDYFEFQKINFRKKVILFQNKIFLITGLLALYFGLNKWVFNFMIINGTYKIPGSIIQDNTILISLYDYLFLIGIVFLIRYIIIRKAKSQYDKARYLIGHRELTLSDDHLILVTQNVRTEYKIGFVYNIEMIRNYYYLTLCDQSIILIPDKVLGLDDFINQLKNKNVR